MGSCGSGGCWRARSTMASNARRCISRVSSSSRLRRQTHTSSTSRSVPRMTYSPLPWLGHSAVRCAARPTWPRVLADFTPVCALPDGLTHSALRLHSAAIDKRLGQAPVLGEHRRVIQIVQGRHAGQQRFAVVPVAPHKGSSTLARTLAAAMPGPLRGCAHCATVPLLLLLAAILATHPAALTSTDKALPVVANAWVAHELEVQQRQPHHEIHNLGSFQPIGCHIQRLQL